ncbi:formyltransferase family protein, partial [Escherichia coli]|uniref:formyltransferase family protein n=3 Tax=Bacteria TaxID=2 RepID=UPI0039DF660C
TALEAELGVIVAYGGLVREPLLSAPAHGWINLHFSLLPRWRGAAPVQRALIAGDRETGASVFQLVAALDAGDVF